MQWKVGVVVWAKPHLVNGDTDNNNVKVVQDEFWVPEITG